MKRQKTFNITYLIGLAASFFFMIWIFLFRLYMFNYTFLVFFWTVKYLSGFGLILIIILGVVAIIAPYIELEFYAQISHLFWTINIFYLIGIGVASFIYFRKIL